MKSDITVSPADNIVGLMDSKGSINLLKDSSSSFIDVSTRNGCPF